MNFSNLDVSKLLHEVAAALSLKKTSVFQIKAYENAASSIEHLTAQVQDLWQEGKLGDIPGVGASLQAHLEELFKTGQVKHFQQLKAGLPQVFFDLLDVPGVGPKTALKLSELQVTDLADLKEQIQNGELLKKGVSEKLIENLQSGLAQIRKGVPVRMLLPFAAIQAEEIMTYMRKCKAVKEIQPLGSLRRRVATIGDLDFAVSSDEPSVVIDHFVTMPGVKTVMAKGDDRAMVALLNIHVDLLVGPPDRFGSVLQHFTGGKNHNIHLRTYALSKGLSLSEEGIKDLKTGKTTKTPDEESFYKLLKMQTPPPEIREDAGEIEAGLNNKIPQLVGYQDIQGDLHLHSSYPIEPSHDLGADTVETLVEKAIKLGYSYLGISDHSPAVSTHTSGEIVKILVKRDKYLEQVKYSSKKSIHILKGLEVDVQSSGELSINDEALDLLDYAIAGVHSLHRLNKEAMTKRILKALSHPKVKILAHPTGRLLNKRESYDADWEEIFKYCQVHNKAIEINAHPNRLDLRDDLVRVAVGIGTKLIINSDSHAVDQMDNMQFGVSVARRGWATSADIVNTWDWEKFEKWLKS